MAGEARGKTSETAGAGPGCEVGAERGRLSNLSKVRGSTGFAAPQFHFALLPRSCA